MMTSETKVLNKRDLMKVFWRSFTMEWTWNYERQANLGYGFAMVPISRKKRQKLYRDTWSFLTQRPMCQH